MGTHSSQAEAEMSIPFGSHLPKAPESFNAANMHPPSSQPPTQSGRQEKAEAGSSEGHTEETLVAATPAQASEADRNEQPTQAASKEGIVQQSSSHVSLSAAGQVDP